jgi:hypothetical protein
MESTSAGFVCTCFFRLSNNTWLTALPSAWNDITEENKRMKKGMFFIKRIILSNGIF